jgi:DNA-binding transcriptional MerR regulator
MKTGELAKQFDVSYQTVRNWIHEFSEYLSDDAKALTARQHTIRQDDFVILATVNELSQRQGLNYAEIRERLKDGYRTDELEAYIMPMDMVPLQHAVDASKIAAQLDIIKAERDRLAEMLDEEKLAHQQTRHELETRLGAKVDSLQDEIKQLQREIGRLEGELEYRRKQDK